MKKILIIHNKYRTEGGEDIAVSNEIELLKKYFNVRVLIYDNKIKSISDNTIKPSPILPHFLTISFVASFE